MIRSKTDMKNLLTLDPEFVEFDEHEPLIRESPLVPPFIVFRRQKDPAGALFVAARRIVHGDVVRELLVL